MNISSTKTEHKALNALESIIDDHQTMEHNFNAQDKEMSWDGYITLFKENNGEQSKLNFDSRVPVQIKGHNDEKGEYINKLRITHSVELADLEAYATEKGVMYFQIFINGARKEIFYASLYPSKIADIIELAKRKGNTKYYSIPFTKLKKNPDQLFIIVKQFSEEAKKQGSAYTPLVQDRIKCNDFDKLKSISLSAVGAKNEYDAFLRLSAGDICLYGKMEGDKYPRPLQWISESKFFIGTEIEQQISINDEVFYTKYNCLEDSEGGILLRLSPNLELRLKEGLVNFKINSTISELYRDAMFLLNMCEGNTFCINGKLFRYTDVTVSDDFKTRLKYIVDLYETLKMIDFDVDTPINRYSEEEKNQFTRLVNLRLGAYNNQINEEFCKYNFRFGNKIIPLLYIRNGKEVELANAVYGKKYVIILPDDENSEVNGYKMPLFVYQDIEILSNLYCYDYDAFRSQIDDSDINEKSSNALLEAVLIMINVFDKAGDASFLDLAQYLLDKIKIYLHSSLYMLNSLQISKRRGGLKPEEIQSLEYIDEKDNHVMYGKYVLLGNRNMADRFFSKFTDEEKEQYYKYPIYSLYKKL